MINIAFKRNKNNNPVNLDQSIDLIVVFEDVTLFPENHHLSQDGWEILPEDLFLIELAKNDKLTLDFAIKKLKLEEITIKSNQQLEIQRLKQEKEIQREFEEFKRWKLQQLAQRKLDKNLK